MVAFITDLMIIFSFLVAKWFKTKVLRKLHIASIMSHFYLKIALKLNFLFLWYIILAGLRHKFDNSARAERRRSLILPTTVKFLGPGLAVLSLKDIFLIKIMVFYILVDGLFSLCNLIYL